MCERCAFQTLNCSRGTTRRSVLALGAGLAGLFASRLTALAKESKNPPPKPENVLTPEQALARLMKGNERYVHGVTKRHDFIAERESLTTGQNPYAGILSCADSRIAPEYAFDSARGDLFVVRVAGNFLNANNLASFEYAVDVLKTPLLMVLGHESCGAIQAAITSLRDKTSLPGHLPSLVSALAPAVTAATPLPGDMLENATRENVRQNVAALKGASPILDAAVAAKRVHVVGGIYRLKTGQIEIVA
jgi:carbonic anhydrase